MHILGSLLVTAFMILPTGLARDRVCPLFTSEHERFGVNTTPKYEREITEYDVERLNISWFIDYTSRPDAPTVDGLEYLPLIAARGFDPETRPFNHARLAAEVAARPGAIWIVGNEPDRVTFQDSQRPEDFAVYYHAAYHTIKQQDPTAKVAFGGIVQPTPVRLLYLDRVLQAYAERYGQRLPVDIWTFHNFVLREELGGWGADIPPGLEEYDHLGIRYTIRDHRELEHFYTQVVSFRQWMAERGYRHTPLFLSEYGILMPRQYGFPQDVVADFMLSTFDYLRDARDPNIGYPLDNNRLVQAWSWYSLNDYQYSFETGIGANGNLFDHDSGAITPVGEAFAAYTAPLVDAYPNAVVAAVQAPPLITLGVGVLHTVEVQIVNAGNTTARNVQVELRQTDVHGTVTTIGTQFAVALESHCASAATFSFDWTPSAPESGVYTLTAHVTATGDRASEFDLGQTQVRVLPADATIHTLFAPQLQSQAQ